MPARLLIRKPRPPMPPPDAIRERRIPFVSRGFHPFRQKGKTPFRQKGETPFRQKGETPLGKRVSPLWAKG